MSGSGRTHLWGGGAGSGSRSTEGHTRSDSPYWRQSPYRTNEWKTAGNEEKEALNPLKIIGAAPAPGDQVTWQQLFVVVDENTKA